MSDDFSSADAVLDIDLDALADNWRLCLDHLAPGVRAAGVVKADAYGLGVARVAPVLWAAGCRRFVVATLEEGLDLRALLPEAEILVLSGPLLATAAEFAAAGLWPVLNSPDQVRDWAALARRLDRPLPSALHLDTGMSRLGLRPAEAAALAEDSSLLAALGLRLVMSHLACADEPEHEMNRRQAERFAALRRLFPGLPGSLAASSGLFLGPAWQADWVRPGAALYGLNPAPGRPNPLRQVVRLQGRIIQVRDVDEGDTVGYGASHRCPAAGRLAVVAAGYADGLFRTLSNRGAGYLRGVRVPLVGRVSMDLSIFDVSALPRDAVRAGDMIELLGSHQDPDALAQSAGTIGYEILTALSRRYRRRYAGGTPRRAA